MGPVSGVLTQSLGLVLGFGLAILLGGVLVYDLTQQRHSVLRNFPIIGHFRYGLERLGEYFRQYFFAGDREEMPFNRATRSWVYREAKNEGGAIGFGSTNDRREPGTVLFVNHPFPVLEEERLPTPPLLIGEGACEQPFLARSVVNISGMSFGALSQPAVQALSRGAGMSGCWMDTGEGGLSPYHLEGNCDLIMQIGTARYGVRDSEGAFSDDKAREIARSVRAFEIKLSQGAKPGKGGVLPGAKVSAEIARIRGIPEGQDSISPNRHPDIANVDQLLDRICSLRDLTGRPVGVKTALGDDRFMIDLCEALARRGAQDAPDFLTIDGGEGGTGAAPQTLMDHMALPIAEALPIAVDALRSAGLKDRVRVIASGKLVTPAKAAWALCTGADFVHSARGFMFALGCIQAMRCHTNTCPTGVATHNRRLQRGLVVEDKAERVANYVRSLNREVDMIAHSCGCRHARELGREHVRIVESPDRSVPLNILHPDR